MLKIIAPVFVSSVTSVLFFMLTEPTDLNLFLVCWFSLLSGLVTYLFIDKKGSHAD